MGPRSIRSSSRYSRASPTSGPGGIPRRFMIWFPSSGGRMAARFSSSARRAIRSSSSSWSRANSLALAGFAVVQSALVRRLRRSRSGPASRTYRRSPPSVLLQPERRQLGQEHIGQPGLYDQRKRRFDLLTQEQLRELLLDPLGRHDAETLLHPPDRLDDVSLGDNLQRRDEPGRPEHPKRIVGEGDLRLQWRAEDLVAEIVEAPKRGDELLVGKAERHGIDREVPTRQVGLDLLGESHVRMARILPVHLLPKGRNLELVLALPGPDGAEPDAGEVSMVGPPLKDPDHGVANRPSHEIELVSGFLEAGSKLLGDGREFEELGDGGVSHRGKDTLGTCSVRRSGRSATCGLFRTRCWVFCSGSCRSSARGSTEGSSCSTG